MTDKVQGQPSQHKPFRVRRDADGSDILASSDTLEEAIAGFGDGATIGAMSFWNFGRSYGPRTEPKVK